MLVLSLLQPLSGYIMGQISQDKRLLTIESTLGKDELLLVALNGNEYISDLFEFDLTLMSESLNINPRDIVGKAVTLQLHTDTTRYLHGYICSFTTGDVLPELNGLRKYYAKLVPWMWFLAKRSNCRIFQQLSTVDVIEKVFKDCSINDYETNKLTTSYKKRDYCVQYNETDLEFVTRLMQEEGISYYFGHKKSAHTLFLTDRNSGFSKADEYNVKYSRQTYSQTHIKEWSRTYTMPSGMVSLSDYHFEKPESDLAVNAKSIINLPKIKENELYGYPGYYSDSDSGKRISKYMMESEELGYDQIQAASNCSSFYAGSTFNLSGHDAESDNGKYLLTTIHHIASDTNFITAGEDASFYENTFECVPDEITCRPRITLKKPRIHGPQTAIVVGPNSDEIYIDQYNRVKVQFHWDREGKNDDNSSCWIRVAESFAGKKWGTHFIPRIGQEVIVDFLEGDPDQPIITGAVYNADNKPPFTKKTQSGIRTHSTLDGGAANYNELRFDDKKGEEEVFIQAEKDFRRLIKNDEEADIQANQKQTIKDNRTIVVTDGNEEISIGKGKHSLTVKQSSTVSAKSVLIKADQSIELKVGGSSIKITPAGITIKSTKVDVKGSAMVVVKGGITKIN